jgi:hypothetical protein
VKALVKVLVKVHHMDIVHTWVGEQVWDDPYGLGVLFLVLDLYCYKLFNINYKLSYFGCRRRRKIVKELTFDIELKSRGKYTGSC